MKLQYMFFYILIYFAFIFVCGVFISKSMALQKSVNDTWIAHLG